MHCAESCSRRILGRGRLYPFPASLGLVLGEETGGAEKGESRETSEKLVLSQKEELGNRILIQTMAHLFSNCGLGQVTDPP